MRSTFALAIAAALVPAISACSSSWPAPAIPSGVQAAARAGRNAERPLPDTPLGLFRAQAEGKLAGPVPRDVLQAQYAQLRSRVRLPGVRRGHGHSVGIWTAMTSYNYLFGTSAIGKVVLASIDTQSQTTPGYYPVGVKVDHTQNVWAANQYDAAYAAPVTQVYNAAGTLQAAYAGGCSVPVSECGYFDAYGFDSAQNAANVFQADTTAYQEVCNPSCTVAHGGGYEFWPAGNPTATPGLVLLPFGKPVDTMYYLDVDSAGNLWFDYFGCANSVCGFGVGEIQQPASPSYTFVSIEPPGFLLFAGGVYASNAGNTINVVDQNARTITQFNLAGAITGTLGPTALLGNPVGIGFNATDTKIVAGDAGLDALDIAKTSANKWRQVRPLLFVAPIEGAAYTPSDK